MTSSDTGYHDIGNLELIRGGMLRRARVAYRMWGRPNAHRDNFVVLPSYYTGDHDSYAPMIGAGRALDPARFCIVALDVLGMGRSTSPSNTVRSQAGPRFPAVELADSVRAQYRVLTEVFGMRSVALAAGWSIGGMQAYHWAAAWPGQVRRLLPWCASARCSPHNFVFLEGVKAALQADPAYSSGGYGAAPERGLRAFARAYCGWAYSQGFFRRAGWRELGHETLEDLLLAWEQEHVEGHDANDLLAVLGSWQRSDIGIWHDDRCERALAAIEARAVLMPSRTDLYFPPEDNELEAAAMRDARVVTVDTDWGHAAGGPGRDPDFAQALEKSMSELLADHRDGRAEI